MSLTTTPGRVLDTASSADRSFARRARARRGLASALIALGLATFAIAIGLFFIDGGLARFSGLGSSLDAVGILAALVATDALLLMVMLSARVPLIDRAFGQPQATHLHSVLGDGVVLGVAVHAVLALVGYALMDNLSLVNEFLLLWGSTGDFILAVVGFGLLLLLMVTSIAAARRRLPYEVWHGVHLVSYAAIGVSIPHMFSMSGLFADGSWQRTYWIGLLALTGVIVVCFRVLAPAITTLRHQVRVVAVEPAGPDAFSIVLTGRRLDRLSARPGQYFHWRFWAPGLWWHQHPFSLSAALTADRLRITVRALGAGSERLAQLKPGTRLSLQGPYGVFSGAARSVRPAVLIGAGIGITPIRAMLEDPDFQHVPTTVILRASRADELYLVDEINELAHQHGVTLITLIGPRADRRWVPQNHADLRLGELVPYLLEADVYVCGPRGFADAVAADAREAGVRKARLQVEAFSW